MVISCQVNSLETTTLTTITDVTSTDLSSTIHSEVTGFTLVELQSDYDQLVGYFSANPKLFTDLDELNTSITKQRELLFEGMSSLQFYRVIAVLASTLRCGHTMMQAPQDEVNDFFYGEYTYPIEVRLFNGHLRVVNSSIESLVEIGDEIVSIDGHLISDLTEDMKRFISADGEGSSIKTEALSNSYLSYYLLFVASDDSLDIEYFDLSLGKTCSLIITRDSINPHVWESVPPYESKFQENYAVLTIHEFSPYGIYTISSFYDYFETFFSTVESEGISNVILDVRNNGGGDPRISSKLFSYLEKTSQPYFRADAYDYYSGLKDDILLSEHHFDGNLYTLINGFCFSTTGHFVSLLKFQQIGTFIGEETNGSFICSDSSRNYLLSNTKLTFRTSTTVWAVDVEGLLMGHGIMPDIQVSKNFNDYILGIDTEMMTAISIIENDLLG